MFPSHDSLDPRRDNLWRVTLLRFLVLAGLTLGLAAGYHLLGLTLPSGVLVPVLGGLFLINLATRWRLTRPWPVAVWELPLQLALDVAALTAVLLASGGAANPAASFYLLPIAVAAAAASRYEAWTMAALAAGCYGWIVFHETGMLHDPYSHGGGFNLHLAGMWITFVISAGLIAHFVGSMAHALRRRDRMLAAAREESLRSERVVALGTLAAGAAHELSTPLNSVQLIAEELARRGAQDEEMAEDLEDLSAQVDRCKGIISGMLAAAGQARGEGGKPLPADAFLREVVARWELMRPAASHEFQWASETPGPPVLAEQTLSQAVINLLNNAADAGNNQVEIEGRVKGGAMLIEIRDRGPGLSPEALARAGEPFYTTKAPGKGLGIGLFLANATVERFGGKVRLTNREGGGACTQIVLPLAQLATPGAP